MADTFTSTIKNKQYRKGTFTTSEGGNYTVHIFQTEARQSIAPAVSMSAKALSNMNPSTVSAANVIAKTNGCMFDEDENVFYGLFYEGAGAPIYIGNHKYTSISSVPEDSIAFTDGRYYPSFCVKKDGTATIRWFGSKSQLQVALPYCKCIIGSVHPLVFAGKNVFQVSISDPEGMPNCVIYNVDPNVKQRFMHGVGIPFGGKRRTLLGHKAGSDGIYFMVCSDAGISLKIAARLMKWLNCDYAVALDGGSPSQMRIKNGYGANGQVTSNLNPDDIYTAVCAHLT